jgi:hypothetical protein
MASFSALELLDCRYSDVYVRRYAVECLARCTIAEVCSFYQEVLERILRLFLVKFMALAIDTSIKI